MAFVCRTINVGPHHPRYHYIHPNDKYSAENVGVRWKNGICLPDFMSFRVAFNDLSALVCDYHGVACWLKENVAFVSILLSYQLTHCMVAIICVATVEICQSCTSSIPFSAVSGSLKEEDILVLVLDMLKCETHKPAVEHVVKFFGQVACDST